MSQPVADGLYTVDKALDEYQGNACLCLVFGGDRVCTMRQDQVPEDDLKWEVKFDSTQGAYTLKNLANGLYMSFDGEPGTQVQVYTRPNMKYFEFRPSESMAGRFNMFVKGTDIEVSASALMSYPPLVALQEPNSRFTGGEKVDWKFISV